MSWPRNSYTGPGGGLSTGPGGGLSTGPGGGVQVRVQEVGCPPAPVADCLRVQMEIGLTAATYHREKFTWNICGLVATVLSATDSKRLGGSKQRGPFCDFNLQDKFGYSAFDGRGRPQCKFLPYFLALAMGARLFT